MFPMIKHKFNAKSCEADGKKFPSKLERSYYNQLKMRQATGEVLFFLRQTPFDIPGGKYLADFTVFLASGDVEFVDVKGMDTPTSKLKRKAVEELFPVTIKIVTR